jgi:hypothetical protein
VPTGQGWERFIFRAGSTQVWRHFPASGYVKCKGTRERPNHADLDFAVRRLNTTLAPRPLLTIDQKASEVASEFMVCVEGQDVGHELVWAYDNDRTHFAVDPAHVEDVLAGSEVG